MHIEKLHNLNLSVQEAIALQKSLAKTVIQLDKIKTPRRIAGLDVSVNWGHEARASAVVVSFPEMEIIEAAVVKGWVNFPYIPGLLSFREIPLTLETCEVISSQPDLIFVDGAGFAHPRRFGLASHLGLFLKTPTIGCAKSHLYGEFILPDEVAGSRSDLTDDNGEVIGSVLRTRTGVKPLFVSVGNYISLPLAEEWVLKCCRGFRLPEPVRLAHSASQGIFPYSKKTEAILNNL